MACESCNDQITGTCEKFIKADCIYVSEELTCSGVQADTVLSAALKRLDEYICEVRDRVANSVSIINVGTGSQFFKGTNVSNEKEFRTLTSTSGDITITQNDTTIDLALGVTIPTEVVQATETTAGKAEIATQAEVDAATDDTKIVTPLKLAQYVLDNTDEYSLNIVGGNVELSKNGVVQDSIPLPSSVDSYSTDFTLEGTELVITRNNSLPQLRQDISSLLTFTQIQSDYTEEDNTSDAYIKNRNASKTVFANYTLAPTDNTYVIVVDSSSAVTITAPNTLPDKFTVGILQKGTGLVTIANADIVPDGLVNTIRGKGHHAYIEKIEGTKFLLGNLNEATS